MNTNNDSGSIGVVGVVILTILAVIAVSAAIFGARVLLSDPVGQGEAIIKKNSATNRIAAQERFETLYADIIAADQKLAPLKAAAQADPTDDFAATNFTGATLYCIGLRNDYNAEARKISATDFRAIDLPARIDEIDPATDCLSN